MLSSSSFPNQQHKSSQHHYYIPRWILDELHRILVYLNRTTSSPSISKIEQEQIAFISEHVFPIVLCGACLDASSSSLSIVAAAFANLYQHHQQEQKPTKTKGKLINNKKNNDNNTTNEERVIPQAILPVGCAEVLIKITSHKDLQRLFDDISNGNTSNSNKIIPFDGDFHDDKLSSLLLVTASPIAIQVPFYEKYTSTSTITNNVDQVIKVDVERVLDYDEEEGKDETKKQPAATTTFRAYSDDDDGDEDENHVNQTKQEPSSSSTSTSFTINRSEYDPKTFSTEVVLKQKKYLISQNDHEPKIQQRVLGTFVRPSLVSSTNTNNSSSSSSKLRSSYHHEGCDLFILSSTSLSVNNNSPLPSHAQHELLLKQHPEFRSSSSTPIKFEPIQLLSMMTSKHHRHWCPILSVPSSPTIGAFLHRTLLLPPCPYLHPRHNPLLPLMKFLESTRGSSNNNNNNTHNQQQRHSSLEKEQQQQQEGGIQVVPFHLKNDTNDDDSRNLQFKSIARVAPEKRFCVYFSSLCHDSDSDVVANVDWQSMYLSILTVFSWITSFTPFANKLKKEALNVLVTSTSSQNALDSHNQIYKLQKIISLCDATKGGQYASSFVGSRNKSAQIGSVEAILSLRYLTTNKMIDDPFDTFAERHDDYEEMFEFRTVRFELIERRSTMKSVVEEKENERESPLVLLEFSIPKIFTRMLINHFDKTASPVIFEIELTRKVKRVVTILGVALSRCEEDKKKDEENALNILITDHHHRCSSSSSLMKWISVSDLIVDLIAESTSVEKNEDDESESESEEPPIACVFVFPVVLAGAVL